VVVAPGTPQPQAEGDLLVPALAQVNDLIYAYEQKLEAWRRVRETAGKMALAEGQQERLDLCEQRLRTLLAGYQQLHETLLGREQMAAAEYLAGDTLLRLGRDDIAFLESDCQQLLDDSRQGGFTGFGEAVQRQLHKMHEDTTGHRWAEVIETFEAFSPRERAAFPPQAVLDYAQALLHHQQPEKAKEVLSALLERLEGGDQARHTFEALRLLGDVELGLTDFAGAREHYTLLAALSQDLQAAREWAEQQKGALAVDDTANEELQEYAKVMLAALTYDPSRDGYKAVRSIQAFLDAYPYSPVASSADHLLARVTDQAESWFADVLRRVDEMQAARDFDGALLYLERIPRIDMPLDKQDLLRRKAQEISTAKAIALEEERLRLEQERQKRWNEGMRFLEAKEYDEAIARFQQLLDSPYAERARERIREAARLAAQENRRRAAELFVRAGRTHDLESRKKLLLASRRLLVEILEKYPQSGLEEKVRRNLARIEEEIRAVDPGLLETLAPAGGSAPEPATKESGPAPHAPSAPEDAAATPSAAQP